MGGPLAGGGGRGHGWMGAAEGSVASETRWGPPGDGWDLPRKPKGSPSPPPAMPRMRARAHAMMPANTKNYTQAAVERATSSAQRKLRSHARRTSCVRGPDRPCVCRCALPCAARCPVAFLKPGAEVDPRAVVGALRGAAARACVVWQTWARRSAGGRGALAPTSCHVSAGTHIQYLYVERTQATARSSSSCAIFIIDNY